MVDEESKIIEHLEQRSRTISTFDEKWIPEWLTLVDKYYKQETRNPIRLKVIALVSQIFSKYQVICEEELMSKLILPSFNDVDQESDSVVRKPIVHLLFDIANSCLSHKHCNAILAIVRKILNKPYSQIISSSSNNSNEPAGGDSPPISHHGTTGNLYNIGNKDIIDSRLIIVHLNKLLFTRLYRLPIDSAVNMLDISVNYLNLTYKYPLQNPIPAEIPMIRKELFSLFLNLRCNKYGHLGIFKTSTNEIHSIDNGKPSSSQSTLEYSPFIICVKKPRSPSSSSSSDQSYQLTNQNTLPDSPTLAADRTNMIMFPQANQQNIFVPNALHPNCPIESRCVNLDAMFAGIIDCIYQETDWEVLKMVLTGLPGLLANKHLVHNSATDDRINQLCLAICELVRPTTTQAKTNNRQSTSKFDVVRQGLSCLTSLLLYRKLLDNKSIKCMLAAFGESLRVTRHPLPSNVPLLTTCLIELQDSPEMAKFLPGVLGKLSTFSPTANLGLSMLEFLSYLILFPKLYADFSEDDYKYIFAIALPYTNSFKFNDYVTCLAFRVIAMWYLNCRPTLRSAFVEFVRKSLQSNVIQPFKENVNHQGSVAMYTSHALSPINPLITHTPPITHSCPPTMSPADQRKRSCSLNTENSFKAAFGLPNQQISLQVNEELIETFADLLSRYTHGKYLAVAPKNECIESLLDRSTSQTWLHGNSFITITSDCANQGWAEIMIRRPTGNTSWIGRLQNATEAQPELSNTCSSQQSYLDSLNFGNNVISLFSTMSLASDTGSSESSSASAGQYHPNSSGKEPASPLFSSSGGSFSMMSSSSSVSATSAASSTSTLMTSSGGGGCSAAQYRSRDPIPLPKDKKLDIALSNFDHITPYETHKVGVIYVNKNQHNDRAAILSNKCGSPRYYDFLSHIGTCIILNDIDPETFFIGGLDARGDDGKYAYFWKDNVTQIIFHVATFMPVRENDPQCNNKNRHIGNDHICIVYNDSQTPFQLSTIKGEGQILTACIVITPLEGMTNRVDVQVLPELRAIVEDIEPKVLSSLGASLYARQLAIHLNLASKILERRRRDMYKEPYVSNWVERLRCIKRVRQRLDDNKRSCSASNSLVRGSSSQLK